MMWPNVACQSVLRILNDSFQYVSISHHVTVSHHDCLCFVHPKFLMSCSCVVLMACRDVEKKKEPKKEKKRNRELPSLMRGQMFVFYGSTLAVVWALLGLPHPFNGIFGISWRGAASSSGALHLSRGLGACSGWGGMEVLSITTIP